jgi:hypothetical protein
MCVIEKRRTSAKSGDRGKVGVGADEVDDERAVVVRFERVKREVYVRWYTKRLRPSAREREVETAGTAGAGGDRGLRRERDVGDEVDGAGDGAYDAQVCSDDRQRSSAANCAREDGNGRDSDFTRDSDLQTHESDAQAARGFRR